MTNPFGDQQVPGSYYNLKERMYKSVSANVNDQILNILQNTYENAVAKESIVLSRAERKRLFSQISKLVLEDILKKLDSNTKST